MHGAGRRWWSGLGLLLVALAGLTGCKPTNNQLRPPKPPEEYNIPPEEEARFSQPPEYPKDMLNKGNLIQPKDGSAGLPAAGPGGAGAPGSNRGMSMPGRGY
jgi:hypothetical protein